MPSSEVWIPSLLRDLTGGQEVVRVAGHTIRQVIQNLDQLFPGMQERLCAGNILRPGMAVAVNGQVSTLGMLQTIEPNSEIHFLPAVSGG